MSEHEGMELSQDEVARYHRQMMLDAWGIGGQLRLKQSTVFVAGAGGLGSPVCTCLAAAGVGRILVCDCDSVELSNLNRQTLHDTSRIGCSKVLSARMTLERLNPETHVVPLETKITADNVDELVGNAQIVVDCIDNFDTRYVLNDSVIRKCIPLVHGSVFGFEGRLAFVHVPETACLRCIFAEGPPKATIPIVGATPAVIGALQAMEVLKYLTGVGTNLKESLLVWDGSSMEFRRFRTRRNPECPTCTKRLPSGDRQQDRHDVT